MNTPEELFHTLLGLGDEWEITKLEFDQDSGEVRNAEIRRGGKYQELKKTRWLWLKNPDNLTEKQVQHMESIDKENLVTAIAYQMRLCLQDIYLLPTEERARSRCSPCSW